jgi:hypothetical protein
VDRKTTANESRYGMVLAKDKNEEEAMKWLIRSVHLYPMNWGCWLEMTTLIGQVEDVSLSNMSIAFNIVLTCLPAQSNIPTPSTKHLIIHLPSTHVTRALPIITKSFQLPRPTSVHLSNESVPPHLSRAPRLPHKGLHHSRQPLQSSSRSPPSQT